MLETGILPLIRFNPNSDTADADSEKILDNARNTVVACSVKPKIVFGEPTNENEISILDITNSDVMLLFRNIINLSKSRFYGINRAAFADPSLYDNLIDAQVDVCVVFDLICQRYSLSPLEVMRWTDEEIATVLAIMEAAVASEKAHTKERD
jgi:hypothetical protein